MRSKYIFGTLRASVTNTDGAVVFPEFCDHRTMAKQNCLDGTVTSAGFVTVDTDAAGKVQVELWGESTSLQLNADPRHTNAVRRTLGLPRID